MLTLVACPCPCPQTIRSYEPDKLNEPITDREHCHAAGICSVRTAGQTHAAARSLSPRVH